MFVGGNHLHTLDTVNGVLDKEELKEVKKQYLKNLLYNVDEIVQHTQHYPSSKDNTSQVSLEVDLCIIKREDLSKILKYIENE